MNGTLLLATIDDRVGWMLVHSLWQFFLIALGVGLALRIVGSDRATLRYTLLLIAMGTVTLSPVLTWIALPLPVLPVLASQTEPIPIGEPEVFPQDHGERTRNAPAAPLPDRPAGLTPWFDDLTPPAKVAALIDILADRRGGRVSC